MATSGSKFRVALGGFMGTGKSTVGRLLADQVGLPFIDSDGVLSNRFGEISEQFRTDGEAQFRERERVVIEECALVKGGLVLATGGGVFANEQQRALLMNHSFTLVTLTATFVELKKRVGDGVKRPNWALERAEELFESRSHLYENVHHVIDTTNRDVHAVCAEVLMRLQQEAEV